ncbi:hypothetical protein CEXT_20421 [Caerostris extrusa]|uniref:Uncharacterized protein n=1 Tax=Caerostris extrusa TaxID=172846 RepID=A0AAV4PCE0_CAEEX|nr:hypothetical protein CEXT_20421 [Caerostris extrusa]
MECVNHLGQGRPDSQIQLATLRVTVSFLSNMECVNLLVQGSVEKYNWLPAGRLIKYNYLSIFQVPVSQMQLALSQVVSFFSNMECVNLLGQGRPVSQIQLPTARVAVSFLSNME